MECDDLKVSERAAEHPLESPPVVCTHVCSVYQELPSPVPVRTRLPAELFGQALMVLEFLRAFGDVFDLKDEFPDGVALG